MTEAEWLGAIQTDVMLDFYWRNASIYWKRVRSSRKLRLFEIACCRRVEALLMDKRSRDALVTAERYADSLASSDELSCARNDAFISGGPMAEPGGQAPASVVCKWNAANAVWLVTEEQITFRIPRIVCRAVLNSAWGAKGGSFSPELRELPAKEHAFQTNLLRDILGNPFRPITLFHSWRTSTVISWLTSTVLAISTGIYNEKAFDRMPILADALQDAGCTNEDILSHCRGPGPHVRGCFLIDLILGKE
jgi:hypothetical protein